MKSKITLSTNYEVPINTFSDGSVDVLLPKNIYDLCHFPASSKSPFLNCFAYLKEPSGLIGLLYILDYLKTHYPSVKVALFIPFLPNGRQDRKTCSEDLVRPFTLKTVLSFIKSYNNVATLHVTDPHSNVVSTLMDSELVVLDQKTVVERLVEKFSITCDLVVSPDTGAISKSNEVAKALGKPIAYALKERDPITNAILKTKVSLDVTGKDILIVDDIAEYGTTAKLLAKTLKEECGAKSVKLIVSHGIFPLNKRLEKPSRFDFVLEDVDEIYSYFLWDAKGEENPSVKYLYDY